MASRAGLRSTRLRLASRRAYSSPAQPSTSPFAPRHLLSIADLTAPELNTLVANAFAHKQAWKSGSPPQRLSKALSNQTVALMFTKRSTRTRVSTEGAVVAMGGHPMFLGSGDIQLGVRIQCCSLVANSDIDSLRRSMKVCMTLPWSSPPWFLLWSPA